MRIYETNFSADIKVSAKGEGGGAVAEIPLQAMVQTMVSQLCPHSPWRPWQSRDPPAAAEEPKNVPNGSCNSSRSQHWSRFSGFFICDPMEDLCWSMLCLKDFTPWKRPILEQFMKNCSPQEREGLIFVEFEEDYLPWKNTQTGAGETVLPLRRNMQYKHCVVSALLIFWHC